MQGYTEVGNPKDDDKYASVRQGQLVEPLRTVANIYCMMRMVKVVLWEKVHGIRFRRIEIS